MFTFLNKESISLFVNDVLTETVKKSRAGYNHVSIVVQGEGSLFLKHFDSNICKSLVLY